LDLLNLLIGQEMDVGLGALWQLDFPVRVQAAQMKHLLAKLEE
jgi:hypothetical protein